MTIKFSRCPSPCKNKDCGSCDIYQAYLIGVNIGLACNKVTLGMLFDLIDPNREDPTIIQIMSHESSDYLCRGILSWDGWKGLESRVVESIQANNIDCLNIWLKKEEEE